MIQSMLKNIIKKHKQIVYLIPKVVSYFTNNINIEIYPVKQNVGVISSQYICFFSSVIKIILIVTYQFWFEKPGK